MTDAGRVNNISSSNRTRPPSLAAAYIINTDARLVGRPGGHFAFLRLFMTRSAATKPSHLAKSSAAGFLWHRRRTVCIMKKYCSRTVRTVVYFYTRLWRSEPFIEYLRYPSEPFTKRTLRREENEAVNYRTVLYGLKNALGSIKITPGLL